jgi:hypothetical protein
MKKENLEKIGTGFYVDHNRVLYVAVKEFLISHDLPDRLEVRQAFWERIRLEFGDIEINELSD